MLGKYDFNPIYKLYESLNKEIINYFNTSRTDFTYKKIDPMLKLILQNNGCGFIPETENQIPLCKFATIVPDDIMIAYIKGGKANEVHEYWDYIEIYGIRYIVVFLDYFENINYEGKSYENEISKQAAESIGNSNYFDAISKIADIFILLLSPLSGTQSFAATCSSQNYRYAPYIIAGAIIDQFKRITENDIFGIEIKALRNIIDNDINLALCGIRIMND